MVGTITLEPNTSTSDSILFVGSLKMVPSLIYCPTEDMLADTLTKALPSPKVKHFTDDLGLALV
jgi:hypothetical protein